MDDAGVRTTDLDYRLPDELIGQQPLAQRDQSRLLIVDRQTGTLRDATFCELPEWLSPDDLLVLNDTKVVPAKFVARRATGGRIGGLFVDDRGANVWHVMLRGAGRLQPGERLSLEPADSGAALILAVNEGQGHWSVGLESVDSTEQVLERVGSTPLPPYIQRHGDSKGADRDRYQTVFATQPGAVAAPTAALHFTDRVFQRLDERGVRRALVTLHVGPGTFVPVATESLGEHKMHAERYNLPQSTVDSVAACRARGGSVVAAGTTTVRVLEACAGANGLESGNGWTEIFITPPYAFSTVDRLLTNFHLPRSTLLALVMAFAGVELTRAAYAHAVRRRYRFYSYGDAMLIL